MGLTNFPHGITSFGVPVYGVAGDVVAGKVFWVCSVAAKSWIAGNDVPSAGTKTKPFATIDYAIGKCTAGNGDVIYVLPGHTETIATAAGIAADVAGVSIIGIGNGAERPIITWSATGSTLEVSAANVLLRNVQCQNAIDSLVSGISVTAAGFKLLDCSFTQPTLANDALIWLLTTAAADDLLVQGNDFRQSNAGPTECIRLVGADRAKILDNYIIGSYSTAAINGITTASLEILIAGNTICNSVIDKLVIDLVIDCTGRIEYNSGTVVSTAAITNANIIDAASCQLAENYFSDAAGETGKLIGTVSA